MRALTEPVRGGGRGENINVEERTLIVKREAYNKSNLHRGDNVFGTTTAMTIAGLPSETTPPRRSNIIALIAFTTVILVCIGCSNPIVVKGGEFAYLARDEAVLALVLSHARMYAYIPNVALPVDVGSLQAHLHQLLAEGRVARVTRDTKCKVLEAALYKGGRLMPKQDDVSDRAERQSGAVEIYRIRVEEGPDSGLEGWLAVGNVGFLKPML